MIVAAGGVTPLGRSLSLFSGIKWVSEGVMTGSHLGSVMQFRSPFVYFPLSESLVEHPYMSKSLGCWGQPGSLPVSSVGTPIC